MASATTAQLSSGRPPGLASLRDDLAQTLLQRGETYERVRHGHAITLRSTVESVRVALHARYGQLPARSRITALAMPKLPSAFSKSIGSPCAAWRSDPPSPFHLWR